MSFPLRGAEPAVRQNLDSLLFDAVVVVDGVSAFDAAGGEMDSVAVERDRAFAFSAVTHRSGEDALLRKVEAQGQSDAKLIVGHAMHLGLGCAI